VRYSGAVETPDDIGQQASKAHDLAGPVEPVEPGGRRQVATQDDLGKLRLDLRWREVGHSATDPGPREGSNLTTQHVGKAQAFGWGQRPDSLHDSPVSVSRCVERSAHCTTVRH
jgi:hypothetical protein